MNNNIESEAAELVIGKKKGGFKITLVWGFLKIKTSIPFVSAEDVDQISGQVAKIRDFNEKESLFKELICKSKDIVYVTNAIAIATTCPWKWLVSKIIRKADYDDIEKLWAIVKDRMNGERFFFITMSAKGENLLRKKETESPEERHSSADSPQ